ncbi:adenylyltransferase/cytidyltransferase family protein [Candidatus Pacearchaeota archaeon]|nr:adenylyltransferase/cytidyltransferase family protein [Candidatus Pacearchaeota archaeon]
MKKQVWENKYNKQLCVTIPKGSGIKSGDVVSIEKEKIKNIVYSFVVADMFHYGHLQLLEKANELADYHICGVLTDKGAVSYRKKPIANFEERKAIISALRCVDRVIPQTDKDPTVNLKKIHNEFKDSTIILVHASNWKNVPGDEFIKKIKGKIVRPPYYAKLSDDKIKRYMEQIKIK